MSKNEVYADSIKLILDTIESRDADRGLISDKSDKYMACAMFVKSDRKDRLINNLFNGNKLTHDNKDTLIDDIAYELELLRRVLEKEAKK